MRWFSALLARHEFWRDARAWHAALMVPFGWFDVVIMHSLHFMHSEHHRVMIVSVGEVPGQGTSRCLFSVLHSACATKEPGKGGQPERLKRRGGERTRCVCSWQKLRSDREFKVMMTSRPSGRIWRLFVHDRTWIVIQCLLNDLTTVGIGDCHMNPKHECN